MEPEACYLRVRLAGQTSTDGPIPFTQLKHQYSQGKLGDHCELLNADGLSLSDAKRSSDWRAISEFIPPKSSPPGMPINVTCPVCATILFAPQNAAGKSAGCPKCGASISVPMSTAPPSQTVPAEELLRQLIAIQERQLYWIRITAIVVACTFLFVFVFGVTFKIKL